MINVFRIITPKGSQVELPEDSEVVIGIKDEQGVETKYVISVTKI